MWLRVCSSKLRSLPPRGAQKQAVAWVNTEALKFIAQGVGALVDVDRLLPYTQPNDARLQPLLKRAKENFEMALEIESSNTDAMLFLSRLYMYYHIPGTSPGSGAMLLEAAASAGNPIAQYELACRLRAEGKILGIGLDGDGMDEKALKYLELAACKKHPEALFLMGSIYLAGKHTKQDVKAAAWCFRNAADQGHVAAATVYGALVAKGILASASTQECSDDQSKRADGTHHDSIGQSTVMNEHISEELADSARHYFELAAEAGDGLALEWLNRIPVPEDSFPNQEVAEESSPDRVDTVDISHDKKG
ncbi:unnamed protein product [Calypogeia fissa]